MAEKRKKMAQSSLKTKRQASSGKKATKLLKELQSVKQQKKEPAKPLGNGAGSSQLMPPNL